MKEFNWWQKTVVYQIYPRSFKDTTGNGIGDLKGIIEKLDYIKDLGIETIWISPFYPSPTDKPYKEHDCGYDISDYRGINPLFGTMSDFETLVEEIHNRDMKLVMDMVMNHTSIEHPWFKESRSNRDNPKRDWYIWKDGKKPNGKKPPTNWNGFLIKCWKYDELTDQWYYHAFLPFQPDLNYRNPDIQKEMLDTVRFWLKKGADGYRLDIINTLFEDAEFRDAPFTFKIFSDNLDTLFKSSKRNLNHPDTLEFCKKLRATIDEFPERFLVGEVTASLKTVKDYLGNISSDGKSHDGLNLSFQFQSLTTPFKAKSIRKLLHLYEEWFPYPYMPTWVFGNHDQIRRITRLGDNFDKAKLNAVLQLTARGVPFIYYGEELGMKNYKAPKKNSRDAVSHHFNWVPQFLRNIAMKIGLMMNRDGCRTPMQWDSTENAGFSNPGVETWLPVESSFKKRNVERELKNASSLLNCYKRLLKIRKENLALQIGNFEFIDLNKLNKKILAYKRIIAEKILYVFINFKDNIIKIDPPKEEVELLFSTLPNRIAISPESYEGKLALFPYEAIILK